MNVLSLFDGMSCGQIALERAGFTVDKYFASEVDKYAVQVTMANYPNTIQLGDVRNIEPKDLPKIDLLIGGSPCQGFSFAGKRKGSLTKCNIEVTTLEQYLTLKEEGFEFQGQSYLFWEYVRILRELKPKYFLLENVKMNKKWEVMFNEAIGVKPIEINSSLVSAQNRKRLYWTNIPGVTQPADKGIMLKDILEDGEVDLESGYWIENSRTINREYKKNYLQYDTHGKGYGSQDQRAFYLNNKHGCLDTNASTKAKILFSDGRVRKITRKEAERLQTVDCGYTDIVSRNQALKMLGNGWTVDVIVHILNHIRGINLKQYFEKHRRPLIFSEDGFCHVGNREPKVLIVPEATKKGHTEILPGQCVDLTYPKSKTRRGRKMEYKSNCLTATNYEYGKWDGYQWRKLTPLECERLQTVPDNYTNHVSTTQRYKMLGNGWTVDVIVHILNHIHKDEKCVSTS